MKITANTHDGLFQAEFEGTGHTDIVAQVASFQEVFSENKCGKCGSTNTRFVIRTAKSQDGAKTYIYHEHHCCEKNCRRRLSLGVLDDGSHRLFPKRKYGKDHEKDGQYLDNNGWVRWNDKIKDYE